MRTTRPLLGLAAAAFTVGLVPGPAAATVLREVPFEEMVRDAAAIVVGAVSSVESRPVAPADGDVEPHTFATVAVHEWLRGAGGSTVVVEEDGGSIGATEVRVAGSPRYAAGEELVLFLEARPGGGFRTYGLAQGRFVIRRGVRTADRVERDLGGVALARWVGGRMSLAHGPAASMPLDAFLATVRALLETPPAPVVDAPPGGGEVAP